MGVEQVVAASPCSIAPHLATKLLQQRFKRDQGLSWKFELVRRREALAKATAELKVGSIGLLDLLAAVAKAVHRAQLDEHCALPAVLADTSHRLEFRFVVAVLLHTWLLHMQAASDAAQAAAQAEVDASKKLSTVKSKLPQPQRIAPSLAEGAPEIDASDHNQQQEHQQDVQYTQPDLSPSQKRMLADAELELAAATSRAAAAVEAASAAGMTSHKWRVC